VLTRKDEGDTFDATHGHKIAVDRNAPAEPGVQGFVLVEREHRDRLDRRFSTRPPGERPRNARRTGRGSSLTDVSDITGIASTDALLLTGGRTRACAQATTPAILVERHGLRRADEVAQARRETTRVVAVGEVTRSEISRRLAGIRSWASWAWRAGINGSRSPQMISVGSSLAR
jgi:hypothetical protein